MPGILQSTVSTYEFTLEQMTALIAGDMSCDPQDIDVEFKVQDVSDDRMGGSGYYKCTKVIVTRKHNLAGTFR